MPNRASVEVQHSRMSRNSRDPIAVLYTAPGPEPMRRLLAAAKRSGVPADIIYAAREAVDEFDARFFSVAPREAAHLDPQHRLLPMAQQSRKGTPIATTHTLDKRRLDLTAGQRRGISPLGRQSAWKLCPEISWPLGVSFRIRILGIFSQLLQGLAQAVLSRGGKEDLRTDQGRIIPGFRIP